MKISAIAGVTALAFALVATCATAQTASQTPRTVPPIGTTAYPGTLTLQIDATDLDRRIFRVKESVPVKAGPLTLLYPQWLPGEHAPNGPIGQFAGLRISAAGQTLAWRRDPLNVYAFHLDVPANVARIELEFQFLSPLGRGEERVVMTREMLGLQWRSALLYPAGHPVTDITVQASLRLPEGWSHASALEVERKSGALLDFKPVSVEKLVDSPVFAGRHMKRFDLDPEGPAAGRTPVFLNVVADKASELDAKPEHLAVHQAIVTQADRLFGARHFARYEFLLALSDEFGGIGLEHHESSENGVGLGYFTEWARRAGARELLPHEYAHSWNGKFRRPADLLTAELQHADAGQPAVDVRRPDPVLGRGAGRALGHAQPGRDARCLRDARRAARRAGRPALAQPAGHDQRTHRRRNPQQRPLARLAARRRLLHRDAAGLARSRHADPRSLGRRALARRLRTQLLRHRAGPHHAR